MGDGGWAAARPFFCLFPAENACPLHHNYIEEFAAHYYPQGRALVLDKLDDHSYLRRRPTCPRQREKVSWFEGRVRPMCAHSTLRKPIAGSKIFSVTPQAVPMLLRLSL